MSDRDVSSVRIQLQNISPDKLISLWCQYRASIDATRPFNIIGIGQKMLGLKRIAVFNDESNQWEYYDDNTQVKNAIFKNEKCYDDLAEYIVANNIEL